MTVQDWLGEENKLGIDIWERKYRQNNESFDDWLDRVSAGNQEVRHLIVEKKFLFGGRILAGRGLQSTGRKVSLSNCYVLEPVGDSIEEIYGTASKLARTYSYGGGCGIDISRLSPRGAKINNAAKETSGAVSFMDTFSQVTGQIGQSGRRGALMISLACDHPDIEEFISIKSDLDRVTKANISIRITDEFMQAVKDRKPYELKFTRKETGEEIRKTVDAYELFRRICRMNNDYAEPGMLFWDRINSWNLLSEDPGFEYAGVNPCAEEPLPAYGSCCLSSINLSEFVKDGKFDFTEFAYVVEVAVSAMNDVLDEGLPLHPLQEQRDCVREWRQIGIGIFGLADMLIKLGIEYGSDESLRLCDNIAATMAKHAIAASADLAYTDGIYPRYNGAVLDSDYFKAHADSFTTESVKTYGLRNSQLLTIAPTGTLSTMLGVSGGIEPIFANYYTRKTESLHGHEETYKVYTPIVEKYMKEHGLTDDSQLPGYFVTVQTLNYKRRILMQQIWQNHIDASISSTINVPNSFTDEDVESLYMEAWEHGLKGVTMFRDGCKRGAVLSTSEKSEDDKSVVARGEVLKAGDNCVGLKRTLHTGCGTLHCEAFFDPSTGDLQETYFSKGSSGGCNNFMIGLSRMISLAARGGISVEKIVDQLMSSGTCPSYAVRRATKGDTSKGSSCPVAIGIALQGMYQEFNEKYCNSDKLNHEIEREEKNTSAKCPECGGELVFEGGCNTCRNCGWSKCS